MKLKNAIIFGGTFVLLAGTGFVSLAYAQTAASSTDAASPSPAAPADCTFAPSDFKAIAAIQNDPSLSYDQEVQAELAARKQLAAGVIGCAKGQAVALQAALASSTVPSDMQNLENQLSGNLNDAVNFYDIELGKLDGTGIAGTQAIAKEVLAWREGSYVPLAGEVSNFIVWSGNQSLFSTAANRLSQTQRAVSFLEDASANADLEAAFNGAKASFQTAQNQNASAKTALLQSLPPDQSLAFIQQSLSALSDTYQKFFDVSTMIKSLLPQ